MKFGISFGGTYLPSKRMAELAKEAETGGFEHIWFGDSQMIYRDPYVSMALCALNTSKVKLGTAVTNPYTRDPSVTANSILTAYEVAPGRMILGIGTGDSAVRRIDSKPRPVKEVESAVNTIRDLVEGREIEYKKGQKIGIIFTDGVKIPVYVVASGPMMLQMAGRAGDGVLMNTGSVSESIDFAVKNVNKGAEEAGKDISEIDLTSVNLWSVAEDRQTAIDLGRPYVEWFMVNSPWLLDTAGFSSQSLKTKVEEMKANYLKYDFIHTTD